MKRLSFRRSLRIQNLRGSNRAGPGAVDLDSTADLLPHLRPLTKSAPGLAIEGLGALGVLPGMVLGQRAGTDLAQNAGG
jgi:hypothetical protein